MAAYLILFPLSLAAFLVGVALYDDLYGNYDEPLGK